MTKKIRVGVLLGGSSAEREVSLVTGRAIFVNLDRKKYNPTLIEMAKDDRFFIINKHTKKLLDLQNKDRKLFDIIFIALHGTPGEDGTVQGMLEFLNIPYTGSNTLSSAVSMNKVIAGEIYKINGLPHPEFVHFRDTEWAKGKKGILSRIERKIKYPTVIKPVNQGSAVGVGVVRTRPELINFVNKTIKKFKWLMAQKFIKGKEATCGVLEREGSAFALPPTHIIPRLNSFYDYKSKYKKDGSTHVCPAEFGPKINKEIQLLALRAHKVLGCKGMSRTDIFVSEDKKFFIIETNTIPGMTPTSLLPEAAKQAGIDFPRMLDMIIEASL